MQNADSQQQGTMAAVTHLSSNVAGNMFESVDGRLSGRSSLHEFRTATCDFRTPASCGTCHQDGGGKGAAYTYLNVSAPFHSSLIRSASEQFQTVLHRYSFRDAAWPIISNVTARPYSSGNSISEHLEQHMTMPVRWTESMHYLLLHGVTEVIEMGPNNVLAGLLRKTTNHIVPYPLGQTSDVHLLSNSAERKKHIVRLRKNN